MQNDSEQLRIKSLIEKYKEENDEYIQKIL